METRRRDPLGCQRDRHALEAAPAWSLGVADVKIDAYEYLLLLHAADGEVNFGTDPQRIHAVADRLRAVSPEHVLVRLLDAKADRANIVQDLLGESVRKRRAADLWKPS